MRGVRPQGMEIPPSISNLVLLAALAGIWGFSCGVCERFLLAPRRRLSRIGPAYFPGMALALFAGAIVVGADGSRFLLAIWMAVVFFLVGSLPALACFHLSRWILRTRFSNETNS
jgi:hypothetical protein